MVAGRDLSRTVKPAALPVKRVVRCPLTRLDPVRLRQRACRSRRYEFGVRGPLADHPRRRAAHLLAHVQPLPVF